jgi:hypothetical protein
MSSNRSPNKSGPSSIPRPNSLLSQNIPTQLSAGEVPPRPKTLWKVSDASLRQIPPFFPKLNPNSTTYVSDAPPSVIAVRISECLRKRSISAEYDDELISATCLTPDRCQFTIYMYRGHDSDNNEHGVDFSDGVVVECLRTFGDTISFHHASRAILQAALGQSTGEDHRQPYATNGLEFRRLDAGPRKRLLTPHQSNSSPAGFKKAKSTTVTFELEQIRDLLGKDRFECQQAAMDRLVAFSCEDVSGPETCMQVSTEVLTSNWMYQILMNLPLSKHYKNVQSHGCSGTSSVLSACASSFMEVGNEDTQEDQSRSDSTKKTLEEIRHESQMRASSLRVLCNILIFCSKMNVLPRFCGDPDAWLNKQDLWRSLVSDLKGVNRPPSVVLTGNRLSSAHEAVLALRCLRILGFHSEQCKAYMQKDHVLGRLEHARACGRSTHLVLQQEAEKAYDLFTEDFRSC